MRAWLKIWGGPLFALVAWFTLSANDWNFGTYMFSRAAHDQFLTIYASALGVEISELPSLFFKALLFDSWLIIGFIAFAKRKVLVPWVMSYLGPLLQRFSRKSDYPAT